MDNANCFKIIKTGKIIEVYQSQKPFIWGDKLPYDDTEPKYIDDFYKLVTKMLAPDRGDEYKARSALRAKQKIKRLVQTNFNNRSKFITLTFNDSNTFDINQPKTTNLYFKKFIERLRYKFGDFKYLYVLEFQKRGAVHYHMVAELPYIQNELLREIWGHGFVRINKITKSSSIGAYISKYLSKDLYMVEMPGIKKYGYSKNLTSPQVIYGQRAFDLYQILLDHKGNKIQYTGIYESMYNGSIRYKEFNLYKLNEESNDTHT